MYAASAAEDSLLTVRQEGDTGFAAATTEKLPGDDFSDAIALTAVGAVPVVLDAASGRLAVVGGAEAQVPQGSVLQQPGPSASSVLVGARDGLLSVDLATGEVTTVAGGTSAATRPTRCGSATASTAPGPAAPARWSPSAATTRPHPRPSTPQTSDLVFRTNRGQIVLNDRETGRVWDVDSDKPTRLDNWDAFNLKSKDEEDDDDDDRENQGDRRPPKAKNDKLGARPGRTTILHPLDNDTAPSGRLLAIRTVRASADPDAKLAISPDGQTVQITLAGRRGRRHHLRVLHRRRPAVGVRARDRHRADRRPEPAQRRAPPPRGLRAAGLDRPLRRHHRRTRALRLARPQGRRPRLHGVRPAGGRRPGDDVRRRASPPRARSASRHPRRAVRSRSSTA